jgi:hypothetical protein
LFDEIQVFLAHDALLEIIDWTGIETAERCHPLSFGEKSPQII